MAEASSFPLPGSTLEASRMPGHWLLARLGKRVLRPGGLELTRRMLAGLLITRVDRVVELAPGMGATARLVLEGPFASYTGIERDPDAAARVAALLEGRPGECRIGEAHATGLPDASATVVYAEAMLTMQLLEHKRRIVREAFRLLAPGGHYGIHELALAPDDLDEGTKDAVQRELSAAIHVGARPLTAAEWEALLAEAGFVVQFVERAPMALLEPKRLVADEGLPGALRFAWNLLRDAEARERVLAMREVFRRRASALAAVALVARKPY